MNKKQFCEKMLKFKDKEMPLYLFWGGKWIFLKVILLGLGAFLLSQPTTWGKIWGGIVIGYVFGKIAVGLMSYRVSKITWKYSEDLINWDKVSSYAKNEENS